MKRFFSLVLLIVAVGLIFVGCSKESDETYFSDVYDYWRENVEAEADSEYFDPEKEIVYNSQNVNDFIKTDFDELDDYQDLLNEVCYDINFLSYLFIHDPKLEDKPLKNAKKSVTAYKEELSSYKDQVSTFKYGKSQFENACDGATAVGIIESGAYETFLKDYRALINKAISVYSKMNDCAQNMYYSNKVSNFETNNERIGAIKAAYFKAKLLVVQDYMYYTFNSPDAKQPEDDLKTLKDVQDDMQDLNLTAEDLNKEQTVEDLEKIDNTILSLTTWIEYYKNESSNLKNAKEKGLLIFEGEQTSENLQYTNMYRTFIDTTLKNVWTSCETLVAFYK